MSRLNKLPKSSNFIVDRRNDPASPSPDRVVEAAEKPIGYLEFNLWLHPKLHLFFPRLSSLAGSGTVPTF